MIRRVTMDQILEAAHVTHFDDKRDFIIFPYKQLLCAFCGNHNLAPILGITSKDGIDFIF